MREIKFRVWLKNENRMIVDKQDFVPLIATNKGILKESLFHGNFYYFVERDDVELMQYTGLKDKNGVEIYEGDIVNVDTLYTEYDKESMTWVFDQIQGLAVVRFSVENSRFEIYKEHKYACWGENRFNKCKVVGNIYENKELLDE